MTKLPVCEYLIYVEKSATRIDPFRVGTEPARGLLFDRASISARQGATSPRDCLYAGRRHWTGARGGRAPVLRAGIGALSPGSSICMDAKAKSWLRCMPNQSMSV